MTTTLEHHAEAPAAGTALTRIVETTAAAVTAAPEQARAVFRAEADAHGAVASTVTLGSYRIEVDEPPSLGGTGDAPNPVEYYLASLLSCQIVTYRFFADRLGLTLDAISASAEGDLDVRGFFALDDEVRPGFTAVRVQVRVTGPDDPADYRRLQEVVDRHCPVLDLTRNPTPVTTTLTIEE